MSGIYVPCLMRKWHADTFGGVAYRTDEDNALYVDTNTRIQILETMARLPRADKEQCAAFIVRIILVFSNVQSWLIYFVRSATSESS